MGSWEMATAFDSLAHLVGGAAHDLDDAREAAAAQRAAAARGALPPQAAGTGGAQAAVAAFDEDGVGRVLHAGEAGAFVCVVPGFLVVHLLDREGGDTAATAGVAPCDRNGMRRCFGSGGRVFGYTWIDRLVRVVD